MARGTLHQNEHLIPCGTGSVCLRGCSFPGRPHQPPHPADPDPVCAETLRSGQLHRRLREFRDAGKGRFILATQDVRGRFASRANSCTCVRSARTRDPGDIDESSDAWDTIDWLVKNVAGNNGRVGMFGISYPGFYTSMGMIDSHPALRAASPQAPISDWFAGDDIHHNGAFFLSQNFGFFYWFSKPSDDPLHRQRPPLHLRHPDGYDFYLRMGPLSNSESRYFKGTVPIWTEFSRIPTTTRTGRRGTSDRI